MLILIYFTIFTTITNKNLTTMTKVKQTRPVSFMFDTNVINMDDVDDKVMSFCKEASKSVELYIKKNHDYGDSFTKAMNTLGMSYAVGKLLDKMNRLIAIYGKEAERRIEDETLDDTLRDMANYALMTLAFRHTHSENK